ncbi:MAG: hypothetical protein NXI31_26285 [bacterium]|nr:hypothetical protein [bacterium]
MNEVRERQLRDEASERLFDVALAEILTIDSAPPTADTVWSEVVAPDVDVRPRRESWLVAALVVFAVAVTVTTFLVTRSGDRRQAQDPVEPLPPSQSVDGEPGLLALDPGTQNIFIRNAMPRDLAHLRRFPGLRCVRMNARFSGGGDQVWRNAAPGVLAPLAELPKLEVLGLPFPMPVSVGHLEVLQGCERLRAISFSGRVLEFDAAFAGALAKLKRLRSLHLSAVPVTAAGLLALRELASLRSVRLWSCPGFDAAGFAALMQVEKLERVDLGGLGPQPVRDVFPGETPLDRWEPEPADLERLAGLPALRSLRLGGMHLTSAAIAALPRALEELTLTSRDPIEPEVFAAVRELAGLRKLTFGRLWGEPEQIRAAERAAAAALGALRLESLSWANPAGPELLDAIAAQPLLRAVDLAWTEGVELERLKSAPVLESIEVVMRWRSWRASEPPPEFVVERREQTLRELATSRSLQQFLFWASTVSEADEARLRAAMGPRVQFDLRR